MIIKHIYQYQTLSSFYTFDILPLTFFRYAIISYRTISNPLFANTHSNATIFCSSPSTAYLHILCPSLNTINLCISSITAKCEASSSNPNNLANNVTLIDSYILMIILLIHGLTIQRILDTRINQQRQNQSSL